MASAELELVRDLAIVMVTAAATTILFQRIRMPVVLGYLVAGLVVGPNVLPVQLIGDPQNIAVLAQLGVLFLLFSLGLEFHLPKLKRVGPVALTAGALEMGIMIGLGLLVASLFGWGRLDALFLGAILAISSTTIIAKVLEEKNLRGSSAAHTIFGILLVEDLVAVILIALLSSLALTGSVAPTELAAVAARIALFVVVALVLGLVVVPRLLDRVARHHLEETLIITALGVAFAMSLVALLLDLSVALGAFIAGAIVAESRASATIERRVAPLRDVFTAIFFVSTGILLDPADLVRYWQPILVLAAVSIVGKITAVSLATFVAGYAPREALRVGLGMAMVGEFSFIIAGLGRDLGVTSDFLFPVAVSVSGLTTLVTPFLIGRSDAIVTGLGRWAPASLRGYARMYTAWVGRRRATEGAGAGGYPSVDARGLVRVFAYAALLLAITIAGVLLDDQLLLAFGPTLLVEGDVLVLGWAVLGLLGLPIVYGLVQSIRRVVRDLVYAVIPPRTTERGSGAAAAAVMRRTIYVFLAILGGVVVFAAGSVFLPPIPLLVAAIIVVTATGTALWGSLRRLNEQVESAVDFAFQREAPRATRDQVLAMIRERSPWDFALESVLVPRNSRAAHRRIRDVALPQRTGATIVTHERDGVHTVNPPADLRILPGDALGVLGEPDQVAHAKALLVAEEAPVSPVRGTPEGEVHIEEIEIAPASRVAGHTLAGSRIRETTGASVVGLRREGLPILNPAPVTRLRAGDAVVVLGSPDQVRAARELLAPTEP